MDRDLLQVLQTLTDDQIELLIGVIKLLNDMPDVAKWILDHKELTLTHNLSECVELARKEVV